MGGGSSKPVSNQSNGVAITTNTGAHSVNSYSNIHSNGGDATQTGTSTGAGVTANVTANVTPALQNLCWGGGPAILGGCNKAVLVNLCSGGGPASQGGCNQMGLVMLI